MSDGKYQKQLRKVFISLGLLIIISFTLLISYSINTFFKNKYIDTMKQSVSSNNMISEVSLSTIYSTITTLINDPEIRLWSSANERSRYYYYSFTASKKLSQITAQFSMIPFFTSVTRLDSETMVLSHFGSSKKEDYFKEETALSEEQTSYILQYFTEHTGDLVVPVYKDDELTDIYYFRREEYSWRDLLYIVQIPRNTLFGSDPTPDFILYTDQEILAYKNQSDSSKKYWESVFGQLQESSENQGYQLMKGGKHFVFSTGFSHSPWKIAYSYENIELSFGQILLLLIPFLLLTASILFFFRRLSTWLYKPVRDAVTQVMESDVNSSPQSAVLDEFQLIKKNAASAKQLAGELQNVMNQNSFLIMQKFYRDLLLGLNPMSDPLYDSLQTAKQDYCVSLIEFQESEEALLEHDIFFCKNTILTATGEEENLQYVNISSSTCAIIIQTSELEKAKEIMLHLSDALPPLQVIKIAISDIRVSLMELHSCFLEAQKILEYKYLYSNTEILTAEQVYHAQSSTYHYPILMENRLIQQIAEGREQALVFFDNLIRENFMLRDLPPDSLRNFIYALLSTLNRTFQELKTTPDELLHKTIDFEELYAHWNQSNIISTIRSIIEEIILSVKNQNATSDSRMLKEMQNYIYENYSTDIMLDDMADALSISAKYCSNLFKKLSDDNFKNFLNKYRIEQAKKILEENPSIKISDLGTIVGFNSANTFIRVFGKYTGMTPKAYGNMIQETDKERKN